MERAAESRSIEIAYLIIYNGTSIQSADLEVVRTKPKQTSITPANSYTDHKSQNRSLKSTRLLSTWQVEPPKDKGCYSQLTESLRRGVVPLWYFPVDPRIALSLLSAPRLPLPFYLVRAVHLGGVATYAQKRFVTWVIHGLWIDD
jgi:hypothetical protein